MNTGVPATFPCANELKLACPLSKTPTVISGLHAIPASSASSGGSSLGLDARSEPALRPLGTRSDLEYLGF